MAKIDLGSVVGPVGPKGPKPIKGTDYYTEEEKQQFSTEIVGLVTAEGTKQTKTVTDEGAKQVQLITEKISLITSTGDEKLNAINQKSEEITNTAQQKLIAITNEGKTKLESVTNEGNRVLSEIGKILETSPEGGNALQLGGKTRTEFDKEIQGVAGGYVGKFPLDSAVLDGIYLLPDTGKFYVCTKAFSDKSLIVPDSNFEELSVYKNRERLSNLGCFENLSGALSIVLSDKIENFTCFRQGNIIVGSFSTKPNTSFNFREVVVTFPFKAKSIIRSHQGPNLIYVFIANENIEFCGHSNPMGVNYISFCFFI